MTNKRAKIIVGIDSSILLLLFILFWLGYVKGISLQGRWIERILCILFVSISIAGLVQFRESNFKKYRKLIIANLLIPLVSLLATIFISPVLTFHIVLLVGFGLLTDNEAIFRNDNYSIRKSFSLSTNSSYDVISNKGILEVKVSEFYSDMDLTNVKINIDNDLILIQNQSEIEEYRIE
jgi:hypothetical protein